MDATLIWNAFIMQRRVAMKTLDAMELHGTIGGLSKICKFVILGKTAKPQKAKPIMDGVPCGEKMVSYYF